MSTGTIIVINPIIALGVLEPTEETSLMNEIGIYRVPKNIRVRDMQGKRRAWRGI